MNELSAFAEAYLALENGVKSKELTVAEASIREKYKKRVIAGIKFDRIYGEFYADAKSIYKRCDSHFMSGFIVLYPSNLTTLQRFSSEATNIKSFFAIKVKVARCNASNVNPS